MEKEYPLASFCVIAYQEEKYIREAIESAFNQDYPNLEIILSDDGSSDKTFEIMQEMADSYHGPHKIILNRNDPNLGPRDHYCKVLYELAKGEFIFIADGDDISLPNRTKHSVNYLLDHPEVSSLSYGSQFIDEDSNAIDTPWIYQLNSGNISVFSLADYCFLNLLIFSDDSRVFRRNVIESFPPLKYPFAEDIFLFIRCLYVGQIAFVREPLVQYRQRNSSIMGKHRNRKKVTKEDIIKYNNTSARQLKEDYQHALDNGFIDRKYAKEIERKIDWVIDQLKPNKNQTVKFNSKTLKVIRKFHSICNHIFEIIERNLQWTNH